SPTATAAGPQKSHGTISTARRSWVATTPPSPVAPRAPGRSRQSCRWSWRPLTDRIVLVLLSDRATATVDSKWAASSLRWLASSFGVQSPHTGRRGHDLPLMLNGRGALRCSPVGGSDNALNHPSAGRLVLLGGAWCKVSALCKGRAEDGGYPDRHSRRSDTRF